MMKWHEIPREYRTKLTKMIAKAETDIDRNCDAGKEIRKPLSDVVLEAFELAWNAPESDRS